MKNYQQDGKTVTWVNATTNAVSSGELVIVGALAGVAIKAIPVDEAGTLMAEGVVTLPKVSASDIAQGVNVYATPTGSITATEAGNTLVGKAWGAAAAGVTSIAVKLNA